MESWRITTHESWLELDVVSKHSYKLLGGFNLALKKWVDIWLMMKVIIWLMMINNYLAGGLNPSENYESQLGLLFPTYGKS